MKKFITILCIAATLANSAFLTGCTSDKTVSTGSNNSENSSADNENSDNSDNSSESENSDSAENSAPEKKTPEGEPTFLIGLDGEPVYTSEISEIYKIDRETWEEIPEETLDRENLFNVVCDGFTYAYIPRPAVNFMDDPGLFEAFDDLPYYIGEELSDSYEFFRVNVGDKIGDLTVKSATAFFRAIYGSDELYERGIVEFEGSVELTGFVSVQEEAPLYPGLGGKITFLPDAESSVKIPMTYFDRNYDNGKARHYVWDELGWYGEKCFLDLGNIADIDSELREGDRFVKVKVTVENITLGYGASAVIKDIVLI